MEKQTSEDQQHIAGSNASKVAGFGSDLMGGFACAAPGRGGTGRGAGATHDKTTPRHSSKRDSGYHTDCSPAMFSPLTPQFTFDTSGEGFPERPPYSPGPAFPGPSLSPGAPHKRQLPIDDQGEMRAEVVPLTASRAGVPEIKLFDAKVDEGAVATRRRATTFSVSDEEAAGKSEVRSAGAGSTLSSVQEEKEEVIAHKGRESWGRGTGRSLSAPRQGRPPSRSSSRHRAGASPARPHLHPEEDDEDDEVFGEDEKRRGVASTAYHHAVLSCMRLPGGDRFRPLLARSIATQTPHVHCQLIDQILACPQALPACARGSAVRRLRYYSEGEETAGMSMLTQGPLPDLVPVTCSLSLRERSLSAPDLESQQRQRLAERHVGRELRRISDEFACTYVRGQPRPGALASIHAELNSVAAFFLGGARRLLYRNFVGYFRCVFTWTRRAVLAAGRDEAEDSPADSPR